MNELIKLVNHSEQLLAETTRQLPEHWQRQLEDKDGINSDEEALQYYLAIRCKSKNTRKAVLVALRKLSWFIEHHADAEVNYFSDIGIKSAAQFQRWLTNPTEQDLGPSQRTNHPDWRPMQQALSANSANTTRSNLMALWDFLINARYLIANPWRGLKPETVKKKSERDLPLEAFEIVMRYLSEAERSAKGEQNKRSLALKRWLIMLYALTFSRLEACTLATTDDIHMTRYGLQLELKVKGGKLHDVMWTQTMQDELKRYRDVYGLNTPPTDLQPRHLILSTRNGRDGYHPISPESTRRHIKNIFNEAANWYSQQAGANQWLVETMRKVTTHWIRHGSISASVNKLDAGIRAAQEQAGHNNASTTEIYLHGEAKSRVELIDQLADLIKKQR